MGVGVPVTHNGAQAVAAGLTAAGIQVCFLNPGRSGMHLLHALGAASGIQCVLTLHESVATGAADGYGRMAGRPAAVLVIGRRVGQRPGEPT